MMNRCAWCAGNATMEKYHDEEWGIPVHDDKRHFEYLTLEAMQCGLSWTLMLKKRDVFRECFADYDYNKISAFNEEDVHRILSTENMIRSQRKIEAIIQNAKVFCQIIEERDSFDSYIWSFTSGQSLFYPKHHQGQPETCNDLSDCISNDLKKRGMKYLGSITIYSYLQSAGIIQDHEPGCWMFPKLMEGNILTIDRIGR